MFPRLNTRKPAIFAFLLTHSGGMVDLLGIDRILLVCSDHVETTIRHLDISPCCQDRLRGGLWPKPRAMRDDYMTAWLWKADGCALWPLGSRFRSWTVAPFSWRDFSLRLSTSVPRPRWWLLQHETSLAFIVMALLLRQWEIKKRK